MLCRPALLVTIVLSLAPAAGAAGVDYAKQVKPLLHEKCSACHGALKQKADLRTDAIQLLRKGNDDGPLVVAGKPNDSRLVHAVEGTQDVKKMPKDGAPLSAAEVKLLRDWIAQGATGPESEPVPADPAEHWSFKKPTRPAVPAVRNPAWVRNPVDAFVAAEHDRLGLTPLPEAPKRILLRRVYLDLIGLPPTPAEMSAFLADASPDAYEKVVDRLLADPRHGQRWGRHWLDVWRYSDWAGYQAEVRESKPGIWRWRDWTVEAVNADKPYDRMVREMLAADELCPDDLDAQRATGYLARSWYKFNRHIWLDTTVEHAAKAFVGLTLNCARCHDHKYDPVSQVEYYRFRAFFEPLDVRMDRVAGSVDAEKDGRPQAYDKDAAAPTFLMIRGEDKRPDKDRGPLPPGVPAVFGRGAAPRPVDLPAVAYYPGLRAEVRADALKAARAAVAAAAKELAAVPPDAHELATKAADAKLRAAEAELASVEARLRADAARYGLESGSTGGEKDAEALARGANAAERRAAILAAEASLLAGEKASVDAAVAASAKPGDAKLAAASDAAAKKLPPLRKAVAEAEAAAAKPRAADYKPLTPVLPKQSTGRRLALANWIASPENPLTARVAVNHVWMRHTGEPIVPTVFDFGLNGRPPTNPKLLDFLARELVDHGWSLKHVHRLIVTSATYRMTSGPTDEATRAAYAANAAVDPDNKMSWRANVRRLESEAVRDAVLYVAGRLDVMPGGPELGQDDWQTTTRRSLYYRNAQDKQGTFAVVFDAPPPNECYRRAETVTPQQALALANSPLAVASARVLAAELTKAVGPAAEKDAAFVAAAFGRVLCRPPTAEEAADCAAFVAAQAAALADGKGLTAHAGTDAASVPAAKEPRQRARENLVHVLMNHNDFVTVR